LSIRPIIVAQISDLHIKPPGALAYRQVDTAGALARCVGAINRLPAPPDLVVISGDLADTPTQDEYAHLARLLAPLALPCAAIPGNHDDRAMLRAAFPDQAYATPDGPLNIARAVGEIDLLLLDSTVPGAPHGLLELDTLHWLDAMLALSETRPALLFLHHPPFITGIDHMDAQNLRNAADVAIILQRHPRARLVAAGHVHRATLTSFGGVAATICPAPNHAVALDLDARLPPSFTIEPPAFHLHVWLPGGRFGSVVTHQVPIGDFDGPYPFHGSDGRLL
jgi:3',5'-cyclic AMP phosphodiesterase CpdA